MCFHKKNLVGQKFVKTGTGKNRGFLEHCALDKRNTKKPKKNKPADFFVNTCISVKKNLKSQNNNITLGFSTWFYVFGFSWSNG